MCSLCPTPQNETCVEVANSWPVHNHELEMGNETGFQVALLKRRDGVPQCPIAVVDQLQVPTMF
jgi:hypothetical protein